MKDDLPTVKIIGMVFILDLLFSTPLSAQFLDEFNGTKHDWNQRGVNFWTYFTGDGPVVMDFSVSGKGYGSIKADTAKDKRGIWSALIKQCLCALIQPCTT